MTPPSPSLPPINAGGGKSSSALDASGMINHASGDGDWVVNMGGNGALGFGGFGGASSSALGNSAGGLSPLMLLAILGAAWYMLKK